MKFNFFKRSAPPVSNAQAELDLEIVKLKTLAARKQREALERSYEAATNSQYWPRRGDNRSGNASMDHARGTLRSWARFLDENHDLAVAILDDMEKKIIGCGTKIDPLVANKNGGLNKKVNKQLKALWKQWTANRPETTRTLSWAQVESMVCRTWLRDGEVFVQHLEGLSSSIRHRSPVPYSIELIEPDYLPFDLNRVTTSTQNRILHGVELTDWREPVAYHMYKEHPGDMQMISGGVALADSKRVSADAMTHLKFSRRLSQVRGVPIFHSVMRRIEDIKEYEESERVAARVAAAMCAVITKSTDFQGATEINTDGNRTMEFNPGMIFDNLSVGEDVKMIGADRPNSNLEAFVDSQIRRVAGGTGGSYSSISKNYNGTYSAQRQELVESWAHYEKLREQYHDGFLRPVWARFVRMARAAGLVQLDGVDESTLYEVDLVGPSMPWIDPEKEAKANELEVKNGFKSRQLVIREKQYDQEVIDEQLKTDPLREMLKEAQQPAVAKPKEQPENATEEDDDQAAA